MEDTDKVQSEERSFRAGLRGWRGMSAGRTFQPHLPDTKNKMQIFTEHSGPRLLK